MKTFLAIDLKKIIIGSEMSRCWGLSSIHPEVSILLVYVNDIVDNHLSIARRFADDTSLAQTTSNVSDLKGIANHDLQCVTKWSKQWFVKFNPEKLGFFSCPVH
jgi:hypothetical protein